MATNFCRTVWLCGYGLLGLATQAQAGGFTRGWADTDILYEPDAFIVHSLAIYVKPERNYETLNGRTGTDADYTDSYWIPSLAGKVRITDNLGCAITYTRPFGGDSEYGTQSQAAALAKGNTPYSSKRFETNEYGATCDVHFDAGMGQVHILGGGFLQDFSYTAISPLSGTLKLDDDAAFGYRLGLGYDISEYAMRFQLLYRSQVDHEADKGSFNYRNLGILFPANGYGSLPQSVELKAQSGVAPGWLVYGSVKWTEWSVLQALNYTITGIGNRRDIYNWKDGWTAQGGVAHRFNDDIAVTANLTYDSGVGNGADIMTDMWTVGLGALIKAGPGEIRVGGGVTYMEGGTQYAAEGASFDATTNGDWAYSLAAAYNIKF